MSSQCDEDTECQVSEEIIDVVDDAGFSFLGFDMDLPQGNLASHSGVTPPAGLRKIVLVDQ